MRRGDLNHMHFFVLNAYEEYNILASELIMKIKNYGLECFEISRMSFSSSIFFEMFSCKANFMFLKKAVLVNYS